MREIIFRGKPTRSVLDSEDFQDCKFDIVGGFVYGNLIADEHEPTIVGKVVDSDWDYCSMEWWCPVVKETVGQFTGLLDRNGKRIFEGDVFNLGDMNIVYIVVWHDAGFKGKQIRSTSYVGLDDWKDSIEVIGNIYDNSDLMKEIIK